MGAVLESREQREYRAAVTLSSRALLKAQLNTGQHEITSPSLLRARLDELRPAPRQPVLRQLLPTKYPVPEAPRVLTVEEIMKRVCRRFGVSIMDLKSKRQARVVSIPRQAAMFLAKRFTPHSLPEIGRYFGGRDHTTVIWAVHATKARRRDDPDFAEKLAWIEGELIAW